MNQKTIRNPISFDGFSSLSDDLSVVTLRPAPINSGITFNVHGATIPAHIKFLDKRPFNWTALTKDGVTVHVVEHLLSALYGRGITNLIVDVEKGTSIPVLDGSAMEIVNIISRAGVENQGQAQYIRPVRPTMVSEWAIDFKSGMKAGRQSFLFAFPYPVLRIIYILNYAGTPLGQQLVDIEINRASYPSLVAQARSFMTTWEADRWRGTVIGNKFYDMVPKLSDAGAFEERMKNEAATHKVLDMVGDLALLGAPARGLFVGICSGHSLNKEMVRRLC